MSLKLLIWGFNTNPKLDGTWGFKDVANKNSETHNYWNVDEYVADHILVQAESRENLENHYKIFNKMIARWKSLSSKGNNGLKPMGRKSHWSDIKFHQYVRFSCWFCFSASLCKFVLRWMLPNIFFFLIVASFILIFFCQMCTPVTPFFRFPDFVVWLVLESGFEPVITGPDLHP
jgi:hypothetical protein